MPTVVETPAGQPAGPGMLTVSAPAIAPDAGLGSAWEAIAFNHIEMKRREARAERTMAAEADDPQAGADAADRSLGLARMQQACGADLADLPYEARHSQWSRVIGPVVDMREVMVRRLIVDGVRVEIAGSLADTAEAHRKSRFLRNGKRKRGRRMKGPRLWEKKRRYDDGTVRRFAYIKYDGKGLSTGVELRDGEKLADNMGALYELAIFVEARVREALNYTLINETNLNRVYDEYLHENKPGAHRDALDLSNHARATAALKQVRSYNGAFAFDRLSIDSARQFSNHRTAQEKEKQPLNGDVVEFVASTTARIEADWMIIAINWFCRKYGLPAPVIERPKVRGIGCRYIPYSYVLRLLRACRGRKFDRKGRVVGRHDKAGRYAVVERFIWLYFYSGTRHGNLPELLWHWDESAGHFSKWVNRLVRQGPERTVTSKRRGQSTPLGTLECLMLQWEAQDHAKRRELRSDVLFINVLHDEEGKALAENRIGDLFREVRELAGLSKVVPHMLKHAGVTIMSHAGMGASAISLAFSTSEETLRRYYTHLVEKWNVERLLDPADLAFYRLRKFSERPLRSYDAAA